MKTSSELMIEYQEKRLEHWRKEIKPHILKILEECFDIDPKTMDIVWK